MIDSTYYPHLEIQIAEHCNLNCASCTHFSPLAEQSYIDADSFSNQLKKANSIFNGHCKSLKIMGGEPLLHPSIDQLLYLARQAMPETKITVQTNGILLSKMPSEFWIACNKNEILIRVTRYPVKLDIPAIEALAELYNTNLKFHPSDSIVKSFNLYPIDVNGAGNIIRKVYPNAFEGVTDFSYTNKTVIRVTREVLCHAKHKKKHARPQRKRGMNRWLHHRRQEQKLVYFALFKVSSAKDKTKYIEESKQTAAKKTA